LSSGSELTSTIQIILTETNTEEELENTYEINLKVEEVEEE